jgi:very-short-patch-repair endonuclease
LQAFLRYAELGDRLTAQPLDASPATAGLQPSAEPLQDTIADWLAAQGLQVRRQVGSGAVRVDLAVVDPRDHRRYALGILTDGPAWYGEPLARARDRLRETVLQDLGWQTERVWAFDWLYEPHLAHRQLQQAIDRALRGSSVEANDGHVGMGAADGGKNAAPLLRLNG